MSTSPPDSWTVATCCTGVADVSNYSNNYNTFYVYNDRQTMAGGWTIQDLLAAILPCGL